MAGPTGLEPAISSSTERHVNRYTTDPLGARTLPNFSRLVNVSNDIIKKDEK